jgi:hypothetical protein
MQRILDTPGLGKSKIAALAHHPAAQIATIHAQIIVGTIAHIAVAFTAGLYVGTDAAIPQQVHR